VAPRRRGAAGSRATRRGHHSGRNRGGRRHWRFCPADKSEQQNLPEEFLNYRYVNIATFNFIFSVFL